VVGLVKTTVLLGFTFAAYNLDRVRFFQAKHGLEDKPSGREAQAEPGPPALRYLDRGRREQPGSAADVGPERPPSHKPAISKGRPQRDRSRLQAASPGFEQGTAEH
jgi:hypothetical protein